MTGPGHPGSHLALPAPLCACFRCPTFGLSGAKTFPPSEGDSPALDH